MKHLKQKQAFTHTVEIEYTDNKVFKFNTTSNLVKFHESQLKGNPYVHKYQILKYNTSKTN